MTRRTKGKAKGQSAKASPVDGTTTAAARRGFRSVPLRSLTAELALAKLMLEGMAKHARDRDYPKALDALGLPAAVARAAGKLTAQATAKLAVTRATGEVAAERQVFGLFLETFHATLLAAYGRRNLILFDYGFEPYQKQKNRHKKPTAPAAP